MCLGVPGEVIEVRGNSAIVDFWGTRKSVRLDVLTSPVLPGDYILNHAGLAVRKIEQDQIADTLALYEVLLTEAGEDPIAGDVDEELQTELISA